MFGGSFSYSNEESSSATADEGFLKGISDKL
jgi:hypothetical protein